MAPRPLIIGGTNLDADQLVFFRQQLQYIIPQSFNVKYSALMATTVFPVSNAAGPAAQSIVFEQFDTYGVAKFISDYADDLPMSGIKGKQFSILVQSIGGAFGYSMQEVRSAAATGMPLIDARAQSARRSVDMKINKTLWLADGTATWAGIMGIFNHPNISRAAATHGSWSVSNPQYMIDDVNVAIQSVADLTDGVENVDTVLLPRYQYGLLKTTARTSTSDTTCLEFLKSVNPGVTFGAINELNNMSNTRTGSGTTDGMLLYTRSNSHLRAEIPVIYETFAAQEKNLAYMIPTHARIAGMNIFYPLSILLVDGI